MDENKQMLLADLLRNAKGMGSAIRAVAQPMIGEIPAGLSGLGTMMLTGDMDKAAENTNAVKEAFAYEPNERGSEYLGAVGRGAGAVYDKAKQLDPKLEADVAALRGGWERFSNYAPGAAAITAGVVGAGIPEGRAEGAVARATEKAAAKQAGKAAKKQAIRQFPEYANEYPPVPPSEMKFDKKKNSWYEGKGESPETKAFMDERDRIQKQMDKEGFDPYFDPEQRFDADPSHYETGVDTYTQGLPKKQATIDQWRARVQTDEARQRLQEAFDAGKAAGGNDRWYQMGQLEKEFIDELGPEEGRRAFKERFGDAMAATTGGADPTSNLLMAQYGNVLRSRGQRPPTNSFSMPVPIGGRYVTGNMGMYDKVINEGAGIGVGTPKRHNFSANFSGNRAHSTIDEQMTDLITPGLKAPPGDSYFAYEELVREMAEKNGVSPRDFQDVAWGGKKHLTTGGKYKGQPMIQTVNESIERTSRLTGVPKKEVVRRGLVRGETPMYGVAAASALGAGAYANEQQKAKVAALRGGT